MWNQYVTNEATTISNVIETKPTIACLRVKPSRYNDTIYYSSFIKLKLNYLLFVDKHS